jgi:hypothetical protein
MMVCSASITAKTASAKPVSSRSVDGTCGRVGVGAPAPAQRRRDDQQRDQRGGEDAQRDGALALEDPERDGQREQEARRRLEQDEPAPQLEAPVAGQPAAGEVAGRVGEHRADEHPVQRLRAAEQIVGDRPAQSQADDEERRANAPG